MEELKQKIYSSIKLLEQLEGNIPVLVEEKIVLKNSLIGKRFKMLTVLEETNKRASNGSIIYKCKCNCGNIVYLTSSDIKRNTSCGCWKKSKMHIEKIKKGMGIFENTSIKSITDRKLNSNNKSGITGVTYNNKKKRWIAYIKIKGKMIHLGTFKNKEDAKAARILGEEIYFKPIIDRYTSLYKDINF